MKTYSEIYDEFIETRKSSDDSNLEKIVRAKVRSAMDECGEEVFNVVKTIAFGIMKIDGRIDSDEQAIIKQYAKERRIGLKEAADEIMAVSDDDVAKAKAAFKAYPDLVKEDLMFVFIGIAYIDGYIDKREHEILAGLF